MKVINLVCKNRGAIEAVEIPVQGNSMVVSGKTGTGKTTVISLLWDLLIKNPKIRKGEKKEVLEAYLETKDGGFLLCKRENTDKTSTITITDENGESKPAAYAKTLLSEISANPLSLFEKTGNERFDFLLKCSTVDTQKYSALKIERQLKAQERLAKSQLVDSLQKRMGTAPDKVEPVDVSAKQKELQGITSHNEQVVKAENGLKNLETELENLNALEVSKQAEIDRIKKELSDLVTSIDSTKKRKLKSKEWFEENKRIDTEAIEQELMKAAETNEKNRVWTSWLEKKDDFAKVNKEWIVLEDEVKAIDSEIKSLISEMQFPIDGLAVEEERIVYNGIDYDALGTSDQILISAALTAQSIVNRKESIHAIRIDRGESMDEETQQKVIETCSKIGVQVFISVVDRSSKDEKFTIDIVEV